MDRVTGADLDSSAKKITITVDKPLEPQSVGHDAFRVSRLEGGWEPIMFEAATGRRRPERRDRSGEDPGASLVRFIARGTGQVPLLGADHVPLAGGSGGPPGTADDGHDYVHMFNA